MSTAVSMFAAKAAWIALLTVAFTFVISIPLDSLSDTPGLRWLESSWLHWPAGFVWALAMTFIPAADIAMGAGYTMLLVLAAVVSVWTDPRL